MNSALFQNDNAVNVLDADQAAEPVSPVLDDTADVPAFGVRALRTHEEVAVLLHDDGLTPTVLGKASMKRFEDRLFEKLRRNPEIRQLFIDMFGREPA